MVKIMPCLDMKDGRVVKGINFINLKYFVGGFSFSLPALKHSASQRILA